MHHILYKMKNFNRKKSLISSFSHSRDRCLFLTHTQHSAVIKYKVREKKLRNYLNLKSNICTKQTQSSYTRNDDKDVICFNL